MAQVPWECLSVETASLRQARRLLRACVKKLTHCVVHLDIQDTVTQLQSMLESLRGEPHREDDESCFKIISARGMVALPPKFLGNCDSGVQAYLSNFLLKLVPEFRGVWVCYGLIRHLSTVGCICDADEWGSILLSIEVECLVFQPNPGSIVVGVVTHLRPTHVGLLIYGLFAATIHAAGLSARYVYKKERSQFVGRLESCPPLCLKSTVALQICSYGCTTSGIISIEGALEDAEKTGALEAP